MARIGRWAAVLVAVSVVAACSDDQRATTTTATATSGGAPGTSATAPASTARPTTTLTDTTAEATTTTEAPHRYEVQITRTEYGVPHIVAGDWGSLGYGQGYAFAQDRACTLIDQVIKVRGERSKWFGAGQGDANVNSDFAYRALGLHADADAKWAKQPTTLADLIAGYVAGFDAELQAEGPHGWCAGQPWVQPITTTDLYAYLNDVVILASSGVLLDQIATAQPPGSPPLTSTTTTAAPATTAAPSTTEGLNPIDSAPEGSGPITPTEPAPDATAGAVGDGLVMPNLASGLASNGWAIGSTFSENGRGLVLANPHFPWEGERRLWESQLTLTTGELDVYGATLSGVPGVLIGFNDAVAWTHTVSAGYRMTLYQLKLAPGKPTSYVYGNETRDMTPQDYTIDVAQPDGSIVPVTRTLWRSHYGPMLNLPMGWSTDAAFTLRDANIDNTQVLAQFLGMDQATSLDEFIQVHRAVNGIPWVNTIAAAANGKVWYGDTSATPNLSVKAIANWRAAVAAGGLAKTFLDNGAILLDGSDPADEWVDDDKASRPGILPYGEQPTIGRNDYVFNANDSHWLANPKAPLTGYSPLTGPEAVPQSARTRMNLVLLNDGATRGPDGKWSADDVTNAFFSNRTLTAELLRKQVVKTCRRTTLVLNGDKPYDVTAACNVLDQWDGTDNLDAKGAPLWREFMAGFTEAERRDAGRLYKYGFDPKHPIDTPNTLNDSVDQKVLAPLAAAAKALTEHGFPVDVTLRTMQFDARAQAPGAPRIAVPGGTNVDGAISIVDCCSGSKTLAPRGATGNGAAGRSFTDQGYPVQYGDSFVMVVHFDKDEGPMAEALLTYGQPDDVASPDYTSQMQLFSESRLRPIWFRPADVEAHAVGTPLQLQGD